MTDGAFTLDLPAQAVSVSFKLVGGGAQNLAVSEVSLRRPIESTDYLAGFARVVNFGPEARTTTITIVADGLAVDRSPLQVPAGNYWIGVIAGEQPNVARFYYENVPGSLDYNANAYTAGPSDPFGPIGTTNELLSLFAGYGASKP